MKNVAFTLAETLITIGMIGVIAALTLPTLMNSTNEKEIVARVKKVNATLHEAFSRAEAKYGPYDTWCSSLPTGMDCTTRAGKRIFEFMQVEKNCEKGSGCFSNSDTKCIGDGSQSNIPDGYSVILSDGTSLVIKEKDIVFDIDGPNKGSNTWGKDLFGLQIINNRISSGPEENPAGGTYLMDCINGDGEFYACVHWIMLNDNADYVHVDSSGKCPDGNKLTDSNPTCN